MDLPTIILGVGLINGAVFLAACSLAAARTWRERTPGRRPSSETRPGQSVPEIQLHHARRRAH